MYISINGIMKSNKAFTEDVARSINRILCHEVCVPGTKVLEFKDFYAVDFDLTVEAIIQVISPLGYKLSGKIDCYGDYEGIGDYETRIVVNDTVTVLSSDEMAIADADDKTLIDELQARGYSVTKN